MASLEQLKKRLRSVELAGQLASAVKTASSAKFAKINKIYSSYKMYADALEKLDLTENQTNGDVSQNLSRKNEVCVVIGHNKGLCEGYNNELHAFAEAYICENHPQTVAVCGKSAAEYFKERKLISFEEYYLPDAPTTDDCASLFDLTLVKLFDGTYNALTIIYQTYINSMTQRPCKKTIYPIKTDRKSDGILYIPDSETVYEKLKKKIFETVFYKTILESKLAAQAATLMAMREACDNAEETAEELKTEINKKRQSAVTTGVLETSSGMAAEWEEDRDGNGE